MAKIDKKTKVSIIVLTINSKTMFSEMVKDIAKLDISGLDVRCIVIDNGSTDGLQEKFSNFKLPNMEYKFIETGSNLGFAGGNNVGLKESLKNNDDYAVVLNDDIILKKDFLINLVNFAKKNQNAGIISPKIYFAKGYEFHKNRYSKKDSGNVIWYAGGKIDWDNIYTSHIGVDEVDKGQYDRVTETEVASGACMIINNKIFGEVSFLDEDLFLYWEDADLSQRVKRTGYKILYYPKVAVWHKVSIAAGGSGSNLNDYFLTRNRYYFALRYAKLRTKFAVIKDTIKISLFGRKWEKIGARDALVGKKGIGSWKKN